MRCLAWLSVLILSACSNAPATKGDVEEALARQSANGAGTTALLARVSQLEQDVEYLRDENAKRAAAQAQNASLDLRQSEYIESNLVALFNNDETSRRAINQQRSAAGWPILETDDKVRANKNP